MIAPDVLCNVLDCLAHLYDTPGFGQACMTSLTGTQFRRPIHHGQSAEHVSLMALLCIRDESTLFIAARHPAAISGLLGLVEAIADRVGVEADARHELNGVAVRFLPVGVSA